MPEPAITIAPLTEARADEAAALLTRAFIDDPLFVGACPDRELRALWLPLSFRWSLWHGLLFGEALATAERMEGVVSFFGPSAMTAEQIERAGFGMLYAADGNPLSAAEARLDAIFDPIHEQITEGVPARHWYLDVIAVDPSRQGSGVGGALIRAVNERADAEAIPVLLMTMQARTLPLYQRYGYAVTHHGVDPLSGLPWWGCRREAVRR